MRKSIQLGNLGGLQITALPSAIYSFFVLWLVLALLGIIGLTLPPVDAIVGALLLTALHFASEMWHQLGHAWAARSVGYPMIGVRYWFVLAMSMYPKDEPELPASVHIRRALGGPIASGLLSLVMGVLTLTLKGTVAGLPLWIGLFLFIDNLLVFTLGALLPLGFTDGSTLLYWWGKRGTTKTSFNEESSTEAP